ncbi:MAG: division/cell wall cluster transcriptional repressor MraZ [Planctomycetaceae bacterium]|nr:division/cell wall cluster transcriptional repressor MraZ [Planctomycetaceae bacterium]
MALTGTYARSLDEKQRVAVPKRLSDEFGELELTSYYVAPGTDKSLLLYSPLGFERLARKIAKTSSNRVEVRNYKRLFYARAEKVELDAQGRIRIPERLVEFAHLGRDVVLVGVHDHAELWDAAAWKSFLDQSAAAFDEIATQAFE